jgi:DNA topoisomerase-1
MAKSLVIVESPAKARTIKKYLGPDFTVKASVGHVKDLPKRRLGIDTARNFTPEYVTIQGKKQVLQELRTEARKAAQVFLAPDPDREGEAIAWHIASELRQTPPEQVYRVLLNEITRKGVSEALQNPGRIDQHKVSAQQARRLLDRLVGYKISPLLWQNVQSGLSAGRVQSVALRIICDREQAIREFVSREYWSIDAIMAADPERPFKAYLHAIEGKKANIATGEEAERIVADLRGARYTVANIRKTARRRQPAPPFTTSTLQQEAVRKLRFTAQRTMRVAQRLYEGLPIGDAGETGLITYMRTDSTRLADDAVQQARTYIAEQYGKDYVATKPRKHRQQRGAQEAHEAIRPTSVQRSPDSLKPYLSPEQLALYTLIWNRLVASQMSPAIIDQTRVDVEAAPYTFRATGAVMRFAGFTVLYEESQAEPAGRPDENGHNPTLPPLQEGQQVEARELVPNQHFTQPPPRYTEASLVSELEKLGIGRPSTYASILSTLRDRQYVQDHERRLVPTDLGVTIVGLLVENFPDLLNVQFTAQLEDKLDQIEAGRYDWVDTLHDFYEAFEVDLRRATQKMRDIRKEVEETDEACDKCGSGMVIRRGRFGRFMACSAYPKCKNTAELPSSTNGAAIQTGQPPQTETSCDKCGKPMAVRRGRFGEFLACTGYPECKTTRPLVGVVMDCPEDGCGGVIVQRRSRRGRTFFGCNNYPACTFTTWQRPVPQPCAQCAAPYLLEKRTKKGVTLRCPGCATETVPEAAAAEPQAVAP